MTTVLHCDRCGGDQDVNVGPHWIDVANPPPSDKSAIWWVEVDGGRNSRPGLDLCKNCRLAILTEYLRQQKPVTAVTLLGKQAILDKVSEMLDSGADVDYRRNVVPGEPNGNWETFEPGPLVELIAVLPGKEELRLTFRLLPQKAK